jgi:CDP-diacylglycerol--glycerol-3-phosphate 3-phosphatidyltransferase
MGFLKSSFLRYIFSMLNEQKIENEVDDLQINNLPNRLTIFRILLIPLVLGTLFLAGSDISFIEPYRKDLGWAAGWMCAVASITDFFDGYIARKRGIVTVFGSFLDPIADKFLVVSSLIMLQALGRVPAIVVIILVLREMYMTSLRLLANNEGLQVPVSEMGKWKTATQLVAIPWLMAYDTWYFINFAILGKVLIYVAAFLSLASAFSYSLNLIRKLKVDRAEKREKRRQEKLAKKEKKDKESTPEGNLDESTTHTH